MSAIATRLARPLRLLGQRRFSVSACVGHNEQNPRSKLASETSTSEVNKNQSYMIGGVGLALGLAFFYLMSRPEKAQEHAVQGVTAKPLSPK